MLIVVLTTMMLLIALVPAAYLMVVDWKRCKPRYRRILADIVGANLLLLGIMVYMGWPVSPWGRAQVLETANQFMTYLSSGNYTEALEMLETTSDAQEYQEIVEDFKNPANYPTSWTFLGLHPLRDQVVGKATFPDGQVIPILIAMNWRWESACWEIDLVQFNEFGDHRVNVNLYDTSIPYTFARNSVAIIALISFSVSMRQLLSLLKKRAHDKLLSTQTINGLKDAQVPPVDPTETRDSPLDVSGIDLDLTVPEILNFIQEGRREN